MISGDSHANLSKKGNRGFLPLFQLADRIFQIQIAFGGYLFGDRGNPPPGIMGNSDLFQTGRKGVADLRKTVIDFFLDKEKLLAFAVDLLLLLQQKVMDGFQITVLQKGGNLVKRHVKGTKIADGVQAFKLPGTVIAVSGIRVRILRL